MPGTSLSGRNAKNSLDRTQQNGLPDRPIMDKTEATKWDHLLEQIPHAILRRSDEHQLLNLVRLLVLCDKYNETLRADPLDHKTGRALINAVASVQKLSAAFGLSPADRKRLNMETAEEVDEIEEFLKS